MESSLRKTCPRVAQRNTLYTKSYTPTNHLPSEHAHTELCLRVQIVGCAGFLGERNGRLPWPFPTRGREKAFLPEVRSIRTSVRPFSAKPTYTPIRSCSFVHLYPLGIGKT